MRGIYPVVAVVTAEGYRRLPDDEVGAVVARLVAARAERPDGPAAPLT
jgi:proteasome beta subunit